MLFACGQLAEKESPDCQAAFKEYQALNQKHPEFNNPPEFHKRYPALTGSDLLNIELPSQKAAREKEEKKKQDMAEKRKNWTPKDNIPGAYYEYKNELAAVYAYRIEFFRLKSSELATPMDYVRGKAKINEKPFKIITSQEILRIKPHWLYFSGQSFVVCTDPLLYYTPHYGTSEYAILGNRGIHWRNPKGTLHNFCGVFGVDGTLITRIPGEWNLPTYTRPLGILSDGKEALLGVGHWGVVLYKDYDETKASEHDDFVYQYLLHWTYPNKIEKFRIGALSADKFNALRDKFRVNMLNQDAYEHEIK